jgi:hypothetical protein
MSTFQQLFHDCLRPAIIPVGAISQLIHFAFLPPIIVLICFIQQLFSLKGLSISFIVLTPDGVTCPIHLPFVIMIIMHFNDESFLLNVLLYKLKPHGPIE